MKVELNNKIYEINEPKTILEICRENDVYIPTLCYHPDLTPEGRCRLCIVEVNGRLVTSCNTKIQDGMVIKTESEDIKLFRKLNLRVLLSGKEEILDIKDSEINNLIDKLGLRKSDLFKKSKKSIKLDNTSPSLVRNSALCVLCGKCVQKCQSVQGVCAIGFTKRGKDTQITTEFNKDLVDVVCVYCGQCSNVCPTGAIREQDYTEEVKKAINDKSKVVVVQTAPAVRATIGETQGLEPGTIMTKKLVAGLRKLGFDKVLDTDFAADLTILEEGTELINRIKNKGVLPMITSCSPGWIKYIEHFYPDLLPNLSTCKSPQQMFGAIVKTYYAKKNNIDPKNIVSVSIMPCTAKKFEAQRPEMNSSGFRDVDYVLTTRELGRMFNEAGIDLASLPDEEYDPLMGDSTGAAVIFGATGGVMEAALRTVADVLENKDLEKIEYMDVRGLEGIKEAQVTIAGMNIKVAVAHGLLNASKLLDKIRAGTSDYHFIEIMACTGGCIGGGGQPIPTTKEIIKKRAEGIYKADKDLPLRKSHKNPEITQIYKEFLGEPNSHLSHKYLHTKYTNRSK